MAPQLKTAPQLKITFPPCDFYAVLDDVSRGIYPVEVPHIYAALMNQKDNQQTDCKIETKFIKGQVINIWTKPVMSCETMVCEWCRRKFKDRMLGVPISVDDQLINGNFTNKSIINHLLSHRHMRSLNIGLIGCLCSWECVLAACRRNPGNYNITNPKSSEQLINLIRNDELDRAGKPHSELLPMPSPSIMQMYGGPLTPKEYMSCRGSRAVYEESSSLSHVTWSWIKRT